MTDTNTALGVNALGALPTGADNTALGANALKSATSSAPIQNVAVGSGAGNAITSGASNVIIGYGSAPSLTTGSSNIIIGDGADVPSGMGAGATSSYLNIGGAIFGSMASGGALSLSATPSAGDTTNKIATTAFVQNAVGTATGAMQFIYASTFNTVTNPVFDLRTYISNNAYRRIRLFLSSIVGPAVDNSSLQLSFAQNGTLVSGEVYSGSLVVGSGTTELANPAPSIVIPWEETTIIDGSAELLLRNFCQTNYALYPSAEVDVLNVCSDNSHVYTQNYALMCAQPGDLAFNGLYFADYSNPLTSAWTFNWALYGIL